MKNLILTISLLCYSISVFSSSNPILDFVILNDKNVEVAVESNLKESKRISVRLFSDILSFKTKSKIKNIQVLNDQNKLMYQFPILSKKLEISKDLFDSGKYKINFYFYGDEKPLSTQITIK